MTVVNAIVGSIAAFVVVDAAGAVRLKSKSTSAGTVKAVVVIDAFVGPDSAFVDILTWST